MGSPGVDEVKWLAPVRPGDRLTVRSTVVETRASRTRPEMGLVNFLFEMFNQAGVPVMTLTTTSMFGRHTPAAAPNRHRAGRSHMNYFEDMRLGDGFTLGSHLFTAD